MSTTLAPSTTYATSTATVVYTPPTGLITTQTITLLPQTTPWPQPETCDSTAVWCTSRPNEVKKSLDCFQFNFVNESRNTYLNPDCYPSGYVDIFPKSRNYSDTGDTLAFPGTACPSGWSVPAQGCTATVQDGPSLQMQQLYCCPTGFDGCDLNQGRSCFKNVATSTTVWVSGRSTSALFEAITYTPDPQFNVRVIHPVFPLAIAVVTAGPSPTSGNPNGGGTNSGDNGSGPANSQVVLSPGVVAGIVLGVVAGLALICAIIFFIFMRRRRAAEVRHSIVPRRATASNPVLPEDGGSGPYDPYAPGGSGRAHV